MTPARSWHADLPGETGGGETSFRTSTSRAHGMTDFLRHRLGREHLVGSLLTLGFIATSSQVMAAGRKEGDTVRTWTSGANILQNAAFFATERGGRLPRGDTLPGRVAYALLHPHETSMHFNAATATPIGLIQHTDNIMKGLSAFSSGDKAQQARLGQGLLGVASLGVIFSGLFRMKPEGKANSGSPAEWTKRPGTGHVQDIFRYAWREDTGGAAARTMNAAVQVCMAAEGLLKKRSGASGGDELLRASAIQLAMISAQFYYLYDRLLQDANPQVRDTPAVRGR